MVSRTLLKAGTLLYYPGYRIHKSLYDLGILKRRRAPVKVLCVGNLTVGGSGKTPFTETLCRLLLDQNITPVVISRGYKRHTVTGKPVIVSDGVTLLVDTLLAGDEPTLLAYNLTGVPIIVDADRYRAACTAQMYFSPDVIVLDDGFQHWAIEKDINIVLWDATLSPERTTLLPHGRLREPLSALHRADAIVLTKTELAHNPVEIEKRIEKISGNTPIFMATTCIVSIESFDNSVQSSMSDLKDRVTFLVSGIASPTQLEHTVQENGGAIDGHMIFRDHHIFTESDLLTIRKNFSSSEADVLLTTQKDYIKLLPFYTKGERWYYLKIRTDFTEERDRERFVELLIKLL